MSALTEIKAEQSLTKNTEQLQRVLAILQGIRAKLGYQMDGNTASEKDVDKPSTSFNLPTFTRLVSDIANTTEDINRMYDKFIYGAK